MRVSALVVQDRRETWFKGQKDERTLRIWTCLDTDPLEAMPATFDYRPGDDELKAHPEGSMSMKPVELSVREIKPGKGGRFVFLGKLVEPQLANNAAKTKPASA